MDIKRNIKITSKIIKDSYRAIVKVWTTQDNTIVIKVDETKKAADIQEAEDNYLNNPTFIKNQIRALQRKANMRPDDISIQNKLDQLTTKLMTMSA